MNNNYLRSELGCKLIELEVSTHEPTGLNRENILELLDCYTVSHTQIREPLNSITRKEMIDDIFITKEKCKTFYRDRLSLRFCSKAKRAI